MAHHAEHADSQQADEVVQEHAAQQAQARHDLQQALGQVKRVAQVYGRQPAHKNATQHNVQAEAARHARPPAKQQVNHANSKHSHKAQPTVGKRSVKHAIEDEYDSADEVFNAAGRETDEQSDQTPVKSKARRDIFDDQTPLKFKGPRDAFDNETEGSGSEYQNDNGASDEDEDDANMAANDDDLDLLAEVRDTKKLKAMLAAELVMHGSDEDIDSMHDAVRQDASEPDANEDHAREDEDGEDEEDDEDDEDEVERRRLIREGKRAENRVAKLRTEEPGIDDHADETDIEDPAAIKRDKTRAAVAARRATSIYVTASGSGPRTSPPSTSVESFTFTYSKGGKIHIKEASEPLDMLIHKAYFRLEQDLYRTNAFPERYKIQKMQFLTKCVILTIRESGDMHANALANKNPGWVHDLVTLLETQTSFICGQVRKLAIAKVPAHYGLSGPDRVQRAKSWPEEKRYAFAGAELERCIATQPYRHPIFVDILSALLWGARSNFLEYDFDFFEATYNDETINMIPMPLVALVATAIHSAILDISLGAKQPAPFYCRTYQATYLSHVKSMEKLEIIKHGALQLLLVRFYRQAFEGRTITPQPEEESTFTYMDIDAMEVL
ncbi:hypothetical protein PsYK624_167190 [Phanerochaete sordida]|uniref:DUF6532 domain-containing protein n=1 Tax=Phanerochaete sordida TaxID=48140 RepID=A0A9P3GRC2_9APHY|nr:hypothetical protein PsYK624_167190 [Phanerochaete sordida]